MSVDHVALEALYPSHLREVAQRATQALEASQYAGLLVHSGALAETFLDDQTYPFRANAPFKAWVPLTDVPDCFIFFEPGAAPILLFNQPLDYWYKPAALPQAYWTREFDLRPIRERAAARAALPADLSRIAYIGEPFAELAGFAVGAINPPQLLNPLHFARACKTPFEIACLRAANRLGARGHLAAAAAFDAGASEFAIQLAFLEACELREQELPYNAIVALNAGGAVLHYQMLERRAPAERHSLLIDAGAEFAGYASDITRTYSHRDADFAALIGQLDEVQQSLCASVRAGSDWRDIHLSAHRLLAELLRDADVINVDGEQALATGLSSVFFPHGVGHLLGLQVHDVGGLMRDAQGGEIPRPEGHPYLRLTRVLEPGFVVTMEPGVYFIPQLLEQARGGPLAAHINWSRVDSLRKFGGIRIEDDLVTGEQACENLTRDAFKAALAT
jgi:Xaa-Pro dipeptidase